MAKKKKISEENEEQKKDNDTIVPQNMFHTQQCEIEPEVQLRLQLLGLSKEILEHQSHLHWETHKEAVDVSIEDIIEGAKELLDFAMGTEK